MSDKLTAAVLRNKGVPIVMAQLDEEGRPKRNQAGSVQTEELWVRFTTNSLVDMEDTFGSQEAFEEQMKTRPTGALRAVLSIALDRNSQEVGLRMIPERRDEYTAAVGGAMALAHGVDPTQVVKMISLGMKAATKERSRVNAEAEKLVAETVAELEKLNADETPGSPTTPEDGSPGSNGSAVGAPQGATGTSSGN